MPYHEKYSALLIPRMREQGIFSSVWTVNTPEPLQKLFGLGVAGITTRNTRLAAEMRKDF